MKTIHQWLSEYGESHQDSTNKLIHFICVPAIYLSSMGLLWSIPFGFSSDLSWLNWASIIAVLMMIYYLTLSVKVAVGMTLFTVMGLAFIAWWQTNGVVSVLNLSIAIFVVAWIAQFYGHKIEGKKPSLFKDIQFLAIGPAWILCHLYSKLNIKY